VDIDCHASQIEAPFALVTKRCAFHRASSQERGEGMIGGDLLKPEPRVLLLECARSHHPLSGRVWLFQIMKHIHLMVEPLRVRHDGG